MSILFFVYTVSSICMFGRLWVGLFVWWCLTPLSTIVHLYRPFASHWQTLSHNDVHLALIEIRTHNISGLGTDSIGSCKFNYYTITATTTPYNGSSFEWNQVKDYTIGVCCISVKHTTLRNKNKDSLLRNPDVVSKDSTMYK